ncbi:MAG: four helix bundle protein [Chitinophagaceae bacterium]|nr:MAG: four helix bundle protein [Chitinophagaceae bacterium]
MPTIKKLEDLIVWQRARSLCKKVYALTFEPPISLDFRYKDQVRGSCGSIMDNIAEGFERGSRLEFINHLGYAKGESGELKSQLYRGWDVGYLSQTQFDELYLETDHVAGSLARLISYLNRSSIKGQKFEGRK